MTLSFPSYWTLYFHNPVDQDWTLQSYKKISTFKNVEDYWKIMNQLQGDIIENGMFFLMKEDLPPLWEAKEHINGGSLCFKIYRKYVSSTWTNLATYMLCNELMSDTTLSHHLTGLTISPKKSFSIIKLWNDDSSMNLSEYIRTDIQHVSIKDTIYKAHNTR